MTVSTQKLTPGELTSFAADYVQGVLGAEETEAVEQLIEADPDFARMVKIWRARTAGRGAAATGAGPSDGEFDDEIADRGPDERLVPRPGKVDPEVLALERMARRWRRAAVLSTALTGLAAAVAFILFVTPPPKPPEPNPVSFVAVMSAPDKPASGWIAALDPDRREMVVAPQGDALANVDRSLQLWFTPPGGEIRSLGTIDRPVRLAAPPEALANGGKLTATIEPLGGTKEAKPTGPVAFEGSFLKVK